MLRSEEFILRDWLFGREQRNPGKKSEKKYLYPIQMQQW